MLSPLQKNILEKLTFAETIATLVEEVAAPEPAIRADLRDMIMRRWVKVMSWDAIKHDFVPALYYDADNMHETRYMISATGWKMLEK